MPPPRLRCAEFPPSLHAVAGNGRVAAMPTLAFTFAALSPRASFLSEMTETTRGFVIAGFILLISIVMGLILERFLVGSIRRFAAATPRSEEHTSELQSRLHLVCRLLLEKKKKTIIQIFNQKHKKKNKQT